MIALITYNVSSPFGQRIPIECSLSRSSVYLTILNSSSCRALHSWTSNWSCLICVFWDLQQQLLCWHCVLSTSSNTRHRKTRTKTTLCSMIASSNSLPPNIISKEFCVTTPRVKGEIYVVHMPIFSYFYSATSITNYIVKFGSVFCARRKLSCMILISTKYISCFVIFRS